MRTEAETAGIILALALLADALFGEYPSALHPVVWMGKTIAACQRLASLLPENAWRRQFLLGTSITLFVVSLSAFLAWVCLWAASFSPLAWEERFNLVEILIGAFLLKASFALRELGRAAMRVVRPLEQGNLPAARCALRSLCSRDPKDLDAEELLAAAAESLAENASDSFVAPLFYFVLFGAPGAVAYRAVNTLDAMIGYRGKYEWLGKCAARLDDLANLIPARLTALLFLATGWWFLGGDVRQGWRILRRDRAKTPSPNGGWPMATMAGMLNVRLDKKNVYVLGEPREPLTPAKVRQAWRIVVVSSVVWAILCGGTLLAWL